MKDEMRTQHRLNRRLSLKFPESYPHQQKAGEHNVRNFVINNNEDQDISLTLNKVDNNSSFQEFRKNLK